MKILIVDDELKARRLLTNLIKDQYADGFHLETAKSLPEAVSLIKENTPDIVLMDIKMPEYSGLEIANFLDLTVFNFQLIFTTAHNEYAIEAFKLSATDYLLKPIDPDELYESIEKAKANIKKASLNDKLKQLQKAFVSLSVNKIALEIPKGFMFVAHDDIIYLEAEGMYTKVYLKDKPAELICKPLKHFVNQLEENPLFYKPHRSYLVNLKYIKEVKRNEGLYMVLDNGKSIAIARDKREEFLKLIASVF